MAGPGRLSAAHGQPGNQGHTSWHWAPPKPLKWTCHWGYSKDLVSPLTVTLQCVTITSDPQQTVREASAFLPILQEVNEAKRSCVSEVPLNY